MNQTSDNKQLCQSIVHWIQTFPILQKSCETFEDLTDGIILSDILANV